MSSIDFEFEQFIDFSSFADDINSNSMNEIYNQNYVDPFIPNCLGFVSPEEFVTPNSTRASSSLFNNKFHSANIKHKVDNAYKVHKPHTNSKPGKHTSKFDMFELMSVLNNDLFFESVICPEKLIETNKDGLTSGNIFETPGKQGKANMDFFSEKEKNKTAAIDNNLKEGEETSTILDAAVNLSETNTRATSQTLVPSPPLPSDVSPLGEFSKSAINQNTAPSISEILDNINLDNIDVLFFNEDPVNVSTKQSMAANFPIDNAIFYENGIKFYDFDATEEPIRNNTIDTISIEVDTAPKGEINNIASNDMDTTLFDGIDDIWSAEIANLACDVQNLENDSIIRPKEITDAINNTTFTISLDRNNFKKTKRNKPQFVVNARLLARADKYWNYVSQHPFYNDLLSKSINTLQQFDIHPLDAKFYKNSALAAILPNYAKIDFFENLQGIDGWVYRINKKCKFTKPALRWCGQKLNFYEPYIVRYKINNNGKQHSKEALCPYCPVTEQMDLSNIFHTIQDSSYMHHVCKDHGVYSTGYEMLPPLIGTQNNKPVAYCAECGEICKLILIENPEDLTNSLISYFRHAFNKHNRKKQNRTQAQKQIDEAYFNSRNQNFVYE